MIISNSNINSLISAINLTENNTLGNYFTIVVVAIVAAVLLIVIFRQMKKSRIAHEIELDRMANLKANRMIKKN